MENEPEKGLQAMSCPIYPLGIQSHAGAGTHISGNLRYVSELERKRTTDYRAEAY